LQFVFIPKKEINVLHNFDWLKYPPVCFDPSFNLSKPTVKSEYKHLAKPEREIQERLDKLKEGPKQTGGHFNQSKQPEREIQERLDKLKEEFKLHSYYNHCTVH
jgi:hypothetical protein